MQQLLTIWNALSTGRRAMVIGATLAMFAAVLMMSRMAANPNLTLLYAGLESSAAGEVVAALEQRAIPCEVRGGAIFVPGAERDALRLTLASEGLPSNSNQGYELLDGLSGFGTTSQMFDAAYWRAKEGELARTIVANPGITTARVHIANSTANPFQRDVSPSASVSVTTTGATVTGTQARALRYLVASAVAGMTPDDVSVIDGKGGLISGDEDATTGSTADDKADQLRDRVQRLIEARVGLGNAVVEVSVDTVTETESILERRFDPENRVVISSDTEETSSQSQDSGNGDVTVASNVPDGAAGGGNDSSSSQNSETRERLNYEVAETTREVTRAPGAVKRLTVAVLVNGTFAPGADGTPAFVPLPEEQLTALRDLVASAVGFEEARGDVITLRSLPFEKPDGLGTEAVAPGMFDMLDTMSLIQMAILAVVALILGLFVIRPILAGSATAALPAPERGNALALGNTYQNDRGPLTGEIDPDDDFGNLPILSGTGDFGGMGMVDFDTPSNDPVDRLRNLIEQRKEETVEILRNWLDDSEEVR